MSAPSEPAQVCHACAKAIDGAFLKAAGAVYHEGCFVCSQCREPFADNAFLLFDGAVFCTQACVDKRHASEVCVGCAKPISVSVAAISALGGKWHAECFVCTRCRTAIVDGSFHVHDGKPFCSAVCLDHAKGPATCIVCASPIVGTPAMRTSVGAIHTACFHCIDCGSDMADGKFVPAPHAGGLPDARVVRCEICARRVADAAAAASASPTAEAGSAAVSPVVAAGSGSTAGPAAGTETVDTVHESSSGHGQRLVAVEADALECVACASAIDGTYVLALGREYHEACFRCQAPACRAEFVELTFAHYDGHVVCNQACLDALLPPMVCAGCHALISGADQSLEALGSRFHLPCLKCAGCGRALSEVDFAYIELGVRPYCGDECAARACDASA